MPTLSGVRLEKLSREGRPKNGMLMTLGEGGGWTKFWSNEPLAIARVKPESVMIGRGTTCFTYPSVEVHSAAAFAVSAFLGGEMPALVKVHSLVRAHGLIVEKSCPCPQYVLTRFAKCEI